MNIFKTNATKSYSETTNVINTHGGQKKKTKKKKTIRRQNT